MTSTTRDDIRKRAEVATERLENIAALIRPLMEGKTVAGQELGSVAGHAQNAIVDLLSQLDAADATIAAIEDAVSLSMEDDKISLENFCGVLKEYQWDSIKLEAAQATIAEQAKQIERLGAETIERCAAVCTGLLDVIAGEPIRYVTAEVYATDALRDVRDAIRALLPQGEG